MNIYIYIYIYIYIFFVYKAPPYPPTLQSAGCAWSMCNSSYGTALWLWRKTAPGDGCVCPLHLRRSHRLRCISLACKRMEKDACSGSKCSTGSLSPGGVLRNGARISKVCTSRTKALGPIPGVGGGGEVGEERKTEPSPGAGKGKHNLHHIFIYIYIYIYI